MTHELYILVICGSVFFRLAAQRMVVDFGKVNFFRGNKARKLCMLLFQFLHTATQINVRVVERQQCANSHKVKFTGLTQTLGQLQLSLIGILSQTAGSTGKLWVNPVNFRLEPAGWHA